MSKNASFGISVFGFRWRAPVLKHEWILNCTTPTSFLGKKNWRYIEQISARMLPWYLAFILNSEIWIKYAETVLFHYNIQTIPFFALIRNSLIQTSLFDNLPSQAYKSRVSEFQQIKRLSQRYPFVREVSSSEWVYLSDQF